MAFPARRFVLAALALAAFALLAPSKATAQAISFGKNKIRYDNFEWRVRESDHFDLYYYPQEESLAVIALAQAEKSYVELSVRWGFAVERRIPFIIYASHQAFEQTNITPGFLPEGVAGFTEFLKGRMVVPFNGSVSDFRGTIHHELVHVYQLAKGESVFGRHYRGRPAGAPLWLTEGQADLWAGDWDGIGEMVLRDLVLANQLPSIPDLWRFYGSFTIYKVGQDLCGYMEREYGRDVIPRIYENLWKAETFSQALVMTLGVNEVDLSERWHRDLKLRYYPGIEDARSPTLDARPLAADSGPSFKPCIVPNAEGLPPNRFLYMSPRTGYSSIYMASLNGPEQETETIIAGESNAQYEALHPFRSRIDVTPAGRLAFISKYHERDALYFYDLKARKESARYQFEGLVGLLSPTQSHDGRVVAFSGLSIDGRSDLYLFYVDDNRLERITYDWYQDLDPSISPDGRHVAFSSDRTPTGHAGDRNLFLYDRLTGKIRALTRGAHVDGTPDWSTRGDRIAFSSDRHGTPQIHITDLAGHTIRVTAMQGGAFDPVWLENDTGLLITVYHRLRYGIYRLDNPEALDSPVLTTGPLAVDLSPEMERADTLAARPWRLEDDLVLPPGRDAPYVRRYAFDLAQAGVALDPSLGYGEGIQASLSDQISDRLIFFQFSNSASTTNEIFSRTNLSVNYFNLSNRFRTGYGFYHVAGDYIDELNARYFERRAGVDLIGSYAFSKFNRIDASLFLFHSERTDDSFREARKALLASNYVSLVHDNTLWLETGPIAGSRWNLTAGVSTDLERASIENTALLVDWRNYYRLGLRTAYAVRFQGRVSEGSGAQRFTLGGSYSLRGFPRRSLFGTRSLLLNQEVRFPLLDGVVLRFPFGGVGLPGVQGAIFGDVGQAWEKEEGFFPDPFGSFGLGLRSSFGGFLILRLDFVRTTDFKKVSGTTDVVFFIGTNY
ncbi:MAG: ShlB/FhaC/HecB family hemolysin secretion/activation protein [Candidatus Eisenbacteria bacterium]|nr:ShlB/FhaC/HecB family hemolysin secretion/activation protein [Candidatus Eisenbacteria bacterium]